MTYIPNYSAVADDASKSGIIFREQSSGRWSRFIFAIFLDVLVLGAVVATGWFLIGYYAKYNFLDTGYPDWMYHAFRVRDIAQFGIASWDHVWGNGSNIWQAYQYIQHLLVLLVSTVTGTTITHSMLLVSVGVFLSIRILLYVTLRLLRVNRLFAFFAVVISFVFSQQWIALKDFSLHTGLVLVPLYTFLWILAIKERRPRLVYVLAACAGAVWSVHPVIGYSASGMLFLLLLANNIKRNGRNLFLITAVFLVASLPFSLPYLFSGYSIINPVFVTSYYSESLLVSDGYFGLSLVHYILMAASWIILLVRSESAPRWSKLLLFYCTAYLVFIYFGQQGYYPEFINKFQFSRAIPFLAILLSFCFASFLQTAFGQARSRMIPAIILVIAAVTLSNSIEIASLFTARPVASFSDPVASYFSNKDVPAGSIFYKDFVNSSYLGKSGLRFVSSYNQHLLPNPYPMRFDGLMKTDVSYTGVTDRQIRMIDDYSLVLGVEYLFVPKFSPLADALSANWESGEPFFERVDEVHDNLAGTFVVLRRKSPIANAFVFESDQADRLLRFSDIPKPTLQSTSFQPWDEEIARLADLIRGGSLKPIKLSFEWPDRLVIDSSSLSSFRNPGILVNQSFDGGWKVENIPSARLIPTSGRFIYLMFPEIAPKTNTISLRHSWQWLHWPVQWAGLAMVVITVSIAYANRLSRQKKREFSSNANASISF